MKFYHRTSKYSGWYFSIIEKARVHSEQRKARTAESMKKVWALRTAEKEPRPDVLPGRNTPEEKRLLTRHLVSVSQIGKGPRYIPTEEQRRARAETMRRVWAERKGLTCRLESA